VIPVIDKFCAFTSLQPLIKVSGLDFVRMGELGSGMMDHDSAIRIGTMVSLTTISGTVERNV